tara:strand:- start:245 stop:442 length:198 start_codon:yes stop_codon:yes gene_type:complete
MKKNSKKNKPNVATSINIPIYYSTDDDGNKIYDLEEMADHFENKLSKIVGVTVMCSVSDDIIIED